MAYTLEDLDNAQRAYVSPEMEVQIEGRSVRFASKAEIAAVISEIKNDLSNQGLLPGGPVRRKTLIASSSNFSGSDSW